VTKDGLTHITVELPLPVSEQCLMVAQRSGMSEQAVRDAVREEAEDLLARLLPPPARIISKLYDTIAQEIAVESEGENANC